MTEFFLSLEQDFIKSLNSINRNLVDINSKLDTAEPKVTDTQNELKQAESYIKQMEVEVNGLADQSRREYTQRVKRHKADYEDVRRTFAKAKDSFLEQRERNGLLGGASSFEVEESKVNRRPESLLDKQNRKLEDAKKTGYTTIDMASSTTKELYRQTEVMSKNKDRLKEMNSELAESNSLIGSMQMKIRQNKLILYGVLSIIALAFVLIVSSYF